MVGSTMWPYHFHSFHYYHSLWITVNLSLLLCSHVAQKWVWFLDVLAKASHNNTMRFENIKGIGTSTCWYLHRTGDVVYRRWACHGRRMQTGWWSSWRMRIFRWLCLTSGWCWLSWRRDSVNYDESIGSLRLSWLDIAKPAGRTQKTRGVWPSCLENLQNWNRREK